MNQLGWARYVLLDATPALPTTSVNLTNMARWMAAEEPASHWWNTRDPLNVAHPTSAPSGILAPTLRQAAKITAYWISQPTYAAIHAALARSAVTATFSAAVVSTPWSGDHYGGTPLHFTAIPIPALYTAPTTSGPTPTQEVTDMAAGIAEGHASGTSGPTALFLVSPAGKIHLSAAAVTAFQKPPFTAKHVDIPLTVVDSIPAVG